MQFRSALVVFFCAMLTIELNRAHAQNLDSYSYDIGSPTVTEYYVDPADGSDQNSGTSLETPWRTVTHAWNQIPNSTTLTQGYRFNLMNGDYGEEELPNYWELKFGTASFPIILRAAPGQTSVRFVRDINMANVKYFYLIGVTIAPTGGGDAFHCESCDHLLIRGCTLNGGSTTDGAHETLKVNQSQYVYIENNNIAFADDNNIDFVGVQHGHIIGNRVHEAGDWCAYVKGGSAYIRVEANEFYNCGTGGFTAGQGTGFQFLTSPWLHYETYDIKVINNLIHDTEGAALGVNGGYNVLVAHNTAYRVGSRSHMLEVVFGERTCDGESTGAAEATCAAYHAAGGWGPSSVRLEPEYIGNRNVFILNNVLYNPTGQESSQHFAIYGPRVPSGDVNLSSPQRTDTNLVIAGNLVWNGSADTPYGIEEEQGCEDSNPTCNLAQLQADNVVNIFEPELRDADGGDLRPQSGSATLALSGATLASFPGGDGPGAPAVPPGVLANFFARDFSGSTPSGSRAVGAFSSADVSLSPPAIDDVQVPTDPETPSVEAPIIRRVKLATNRVGRRVEVELLVRVVSSEALDSISAVVRRGSNDLRSIRMRLLRGQRYRGVGRFRVASGRMLSIVLTAANGGGAASKSKRLRAP